MKTTAASNSNTTNLYNIKFMFLVHNNIVPGNDL